jgi:hypothetical protein
MFGFSPVIEDRPPLPDPKVPLVETALGQGQDGVVDSIVEAVFENDNKSTPSKPKPSKTKRQQQPRVKENTWLQLTQPLRFLDVWLAALEGDVDKSLVRQAQILRQHASDDDEVTPNKRHKPPQSRISLLPTSSFYVTPFVAPTKSAAEARKIALLQLDRLTAIPPQEAMIAIGGPSFVGEDGQGHFQLFVTKKKTVAELRRAHSEHDKIEAFVALDEPNIDADTVLAPGIGGVFRDDLGLAKRASRRLLSAGLLGLCSITFALLTWSLHQRFDRQVAALTTATREANQVKAKVVGERAQALSQLSAFGQGATTSSADRVLVTLSDMTARAPPDVRLQLIEVAQDKVRIKGAAKDANAARMAFMTPVVPGQNTQSAQGSQNGQPNTASLNPVPVLTQPPSPSPGPVMASLPSPGPSASAAANLIQPNLPVPNSPQPVQWQTFEIEVGASTVRTLSPNAAISPPATPTTIPPAIPSAVPPNQEGGTP